MTRKYFSKPNVAAQIHCVSSYFLMSRHWEDPSLSFERTLIGFYLDALEWSMLYPLRLNCLISDNSASLYSQKQCRSSQFGNLIAVACIQWSPRLPKEQIYDELYLWVSYCDENVLFASCSTENFDLYDEGWLSYYCLRSSLTREDLILGVWSKVRLLSRRNVDLFT